MPKPSPTILYYTPVIGAPLGHTIADMTGLDALVIDVQAKFSVDGPGSIVPIIEAQIARGTPVFIISGQRGEHEQTVARRKERIAIGAGAIPLGACRAPPPEVVAGLSEIFSQQTTLDERIAETQRRFYVPAIEAHEFSQLLAFLVEGGSLELGKFVYTDYQAWQTVKNSPSYKPLADALQRSAIACTPQIVDAMIQRRITDFYSFGPSPEVDKVILELCAARNMRVVYHPIDISKRALVHTRTTLENHLSAAVPGWRDYVTLVDEKPQLFEEVETDRAVCVSYPGGQIVNNSSLLSDARRVCGAGGLVVVDLHLRTTTEDDRALWMSIYDSDEERSMFTAAVQQFLIGGYGEDGWHIAVKYLPTPNQPHRISFQLAADHDVPVQCNMVNVTLKADVERELMMSRKYTGGEFNQESAQLGYTIIGQSTKPVVKHGIRHFGAASTMILAYSGT